MSQTIDVTGLSPEAIRVVQTMVDVFREVSAELPAPSAYWPGLLPVETAEKWVARFAAHVDSRPEYKGVLEIDDDRGSMNDRDGAN
jgi:hypothetical protein